MLRGYSVVWVYQSRGNYRLLLGDLDMIHHLSRHKWAHRPLAHWIPCLRLRLQTSQALSTHSLCELHSRTSLLRGCLNKRRGRGNKIKYMSRRRCSRRECTYCCLESFNNPSAGHTVDIRMTISKRSILWMLSRTLGTMNHSHPKKD